jgi:hypothetical protein
MLLKTVDPPQFKVYPHSSFSFNDPKSVITVLNDFPQFSVQIHWSQKKPQIGVLLCSTHLESMGNKILRLQHLPSKINVGLLQDSKPCQSWLGIIRSWLIVKQCCYQLSIKLRRQRRGRRP